MQLVLASLLLPNERHITSHADAILGIVLGADPHRSTRVNDIMNLRQRTCTRITGSVPVRIMHATTGR